MLRRARLWHALAADFTRASFGGDIPDGTIAAALRDTGPGHGAV